MLRRRHVENLHGLSARHARHAAVILILLILRRLLLLLLLILPVRMMVVVSASTSAATDGHVSGMGRPNCAWCIAGAFHHALRIRKPWVERIERHRTKTVARIGRFGLAGIVIMPGVVCAHDGRSRLDAREVTADVCVPKMLGFFPSPVIALAFVFFPPAVERVPAHTHCGDDEERCES